MLIKRISTIFVLLIILFITLVIYWPGLQGGFLFDDQPNLGGLSNYNSFGNWEDAKQFITSGDAGPTGRPISLLTFLPNADSWPHDARPFKLVNLYIHLLCGAFLYWATRLLLISYGYLEKKAAWIAVLSCSVWLLHPFFVSTTLYVIQRMAQLPLLFSLLGIIGYLKGRALLVVHPLLAYVIMTVSIGLATILATFSKENGALLPLLVLVIEFCNPIKNNKPIWYWRAICLWLPSLIIAGLIIHSIDFSPNPWPYRDFNQIERLWSEARIVCDYLFQLFVPKVEGYGLFQDGYQVSRGWFQPLTTLLSIVFLTILLCCAFAVRNKYPLFTLAILFFFAAHLIESTVFGLELYFEHRNYVAAIFLFLPIASWLYWLSEQIKPSVVILVSCLILASLALMTWQRAVLWSDSTKLQVYWAQKNPQSVRAQSKFAELLMQHGQSQQANQVLEQVIAQNPDTALLIQLLKQKIEIGEASQPDILNIHQQILIQKADGAAIWGLRGLVGKIVDNPQLTNLYAAEVINILDQVVKNNMSYRHYPDFYPLSFFLRGQLYIALQQPKPAYDNYYQAAVEYKDVSSALAMVADLGNRGYYELALQLMEEIESIYRQQLIAMPEYRKTLNDLRVNIGKDFQATKMQDAPQEQVNQR